MGKIRISSDLVAAAVTKIGYVEGMRYDGQFLIMPDVTDQDLIDLIGDMEQIKDASAAAEALHRLDEIKSACRERIYSTASRETQMNVATMAAAASAKTASNRSRTENAVLAAAAGGIAWVNAMKQAVATIAADPTLDPHDDANWPVIPPEVAAVYEQM